MARLRILSGRSIFCASRKPGKSPELSARRNRSPLPNPAGAATNPVPVEVGKIQKVLR